MPADATNFAPRNHLSSVDTNTRVAIPQLKHPRLNRNTMNKDSCFTYVHMHRASDADLFEDFCKDKLPDDEIYVPPQHQPINPEDEDDVVPDQHAAFGIQRATQHVKEPAWKDLGLASLMNKGPGKEGSKSASNSKGLKGLPR